MVEAIQDVVTAELEAETQPDSTHPDDARIEAELTQEISTLWSQHTRLNADRRATAAELRQIRMALAARLAAMKSLLCRPDLGRASQWRGWLKHHGIPRSTADRLVARHSETLGHDESVPNGAPSEPETPGPEKMAETVWRSVRKVLVASEAFIAFITSIAHL